MRKHCKYCHEIFVGTARKKVCDDCRIKRKHTRDMELYLRKQTPEHKEKLKARKAEKESEEEIKKNNVDVDEANHEYGTWTGHKKYELEIWDTSTRSYRMVTVTDIGRSAPVTPYKGLRNEKQ